MIGKGLILWGEEEYPQVLYSIFNPKFTGREFPALLTYRNCCNKKKFRASKLILLESFPVHYTVIECSFIYREMLFLGSVSKGVVLPIIKLCTEGSDLNFTLLILCKTEPYWFPTLSLPSAEVTSHQEYETDFSINWKSKDWCMMFKPRISPSIRRSKEKTGMRQFIADLMLWAIEFISNLLVNSSWHISFYSAHVIPTKCSAILTLANISLHSFLLHGNINEL